jgi:hypothetical protein
MRTIEIKGELGVVRIRPRETFRKEGIVWAVVSKRVGDNILDVFGRDAPAMYPSSDTTEWIVAVDIY